jgi:hypothetical protein
VPPFTYRCPETGLSPRKLRVDKTSYGAYEACGVCRLQAHSLWRRHRTRAKSSMKLLVVIFILKCRHCDSGRSKCSVVFAIRRLRWGPKLRLRYFPAMFGRSQFPKRVLCPKLDISPACASLSPLDAAPQSQKVLSWFAQKSPDALRCDWGDIRQPTAAAALAPQRPKHTSCFSLAALNCRRPHCAAAHRLAIIHCGLMSAPTPVGGTSGDGD